MEHNTRVPATLLFWSGFGHRRHCGPNRREAEEEDEEVEVAGSKQATMEQTQKQVGVCSRRLLTWITLPMYSVLLPESLMSDGYEKSNQAGLLLLSTLRST